MYLICNADDAARAANALAVGATPGLKEGSNPLRSDVSLRISDLGDADSRLYLFLDSSTARFLCSSYCDNAMSDQEPIMTVASTSYQPRPARKQVTEAKFNAIRNAFAARPDSAGTFNIWYENFAGADREENEAMKAKRETRCDIARDSGYSKADIALRNQAARSRAGIPDEGVYCCIHFARGCCPHGVDCNFLHRLPRPNDFPNQARDCFGREKQGGYKDDMSGTGSLSAINRTLYVGRIHEEHGVSSSAANTGGAAWRDGGKTLKGGRSAGSAQKNGKTQDPAAYRPQHNSVRSETDNATEKVVRRHFDEWGEIEKLRVLNGRSCAFVTYKYEANAQFAKEAMLNQSMDHDEILNVRWASDDPNPAAKKRNAEQLRAAGEAAIMAGMSIQAIEAQRSLRALEALGTDSAENDDYKRRRIADEQYEQQMRELDEENQRGWDEIILQREQAARLASQTATTNGGASHSTPGIPSSHVLGQAQSGTNSASRSALSSLASYASDSEDEA